MDIDYIGDQAKIDEGVREAYDGRVMVYLLNGQSYYAGAKLRTRTAIRRRGRWHVRDHGLVPIRGISKDGDTFTT